ncbi:MAG: MBL fold metallo-hydrolase [Betaproteobacteria bacterium]|nr:MBL fold metallo-hydrolase [Betaproteobacteria bacterium]
MSPALTPSVVPSRPPASAPANGLEYAFGEEVPAPAGSIEVAPGVHWLRMPLPFALDHINLWLLADGDGWTLIDCGLNHKATVALWEQAFGGLLGGRPIKRLVVTHYHADHVGLAGWHQRRWDAPLWMTEGEFLTALALYHETPGHHRGAMFDLFRAHGLDEARIEGMKVFSGAYPRLISELPHTFRRIMPDERLEIGGRPWRVLIGHGHAPEHASLHCDALGVLIAGDMVLPRISTNISVRPVEPEGNPLAQFLQSLERFAALPHDTLVLPSHGLPFRGMQARIAQLQKHHAERLDELKAACSEPRCARELVPVLFRRTLDDHAWYFAMGECIAHLNCLMHAGWLRRERDARGVLRFSAT